jgi:hypothetical protein
MACTRTFTEHERLQNLILEVLNISKAQRHALDMVASSPECSLKCQCENVGSEFHNGVLPHVSPKRGQNFLQKCTKRKENWGQETEIICGFLQMNLGFRRTLHTHGFNHPLYSSMTQIVVFQYWPHFEFLGFCILEKCFSIWGHPVACEVSWGFKFFFQNSILKTLNHYWKFIECIKIRTFMR